MAFEITDSKCVVCDATPLEIDLMETPSKAEIGTCRVCGTYYSKWHNGEVLDNWHSPIRQSAIQILREYWADTHTKFPPMDPSQPNPPGVGDAEIDSYNEWMAKRSDEIARIGDEVIKEHKETLRKLA
jgi:hypothetical protein